jgi:hypothetical protein
VLHGAGVKLEMFSLILLLLLWFQMWKVWVDVMVMVVQSVLEDFLELEPENL